MFRDLKKQRYIFALPYEGNLLLGTTEQRVSTPEDKEILDSEVNYLLESINIYTKAFSFHSKSLPKASNLEFKENMIFFFF